MKAYQKFYFNIEIIRGEVARTCTIFCKWSKHKRGLWKSTCMCKSSYARVDSSVCLCIYPHLCIHTGQIKSQQVLKKTGLERAVACATLVGLFESRGPIHMVCDNTAALQWAAQLHCHCSAEAGVTATIRQQSTHRHTSDTLQVQLQTTAIQGAVTDLLVERPAFNLLKM